MRTLFSIIVVVLVLFVIAAAKVLLRTNPEIGVAIIGGCGGLLALCWFLYSRFDQL